MPSRKSKKGFEDFHGRPSRKTREIDLPSFAEIIELGFAHSIEYLPIPGSSKGSKIYRHEFSAGVRLYCDSGRKVLLLHGGRLKIREWIEN